MHIIWVAKSRNIWLVISRDLSRTTMNITVCMLLLTMGTSVSLDIIHNYLSCLYISICNLIKTFICLSIIMLCIFPNILSTRWATQTFIMLKSILILSTQWHIFTECSWYFAQLIISRLSLFCQWDFAEVEATLILHNSRCNHVQITKHSPIKSKIRLVSDFIVYDTYRAEPRINRVLNYIIVLYVFITQSTL